MTLAELIAAEPANAARSHAEVLAWLRETVQVRQPLNSRQLLRWGGAGGRLAKLEDAAADRELPREVRSIARAAVLVVSREDTQLELDDPSHEALVDGLVAAGVLSADDKSELVAMATVEQPRGALAGEPNPSLHQVMVARGKL